MGPVPPYHILALYLAWSWLRERQVATPPAMAARTEGMTALARLVLRLTPRTTAELAAQMVVATNDGATPPDPAFVTLIREVAQEGAPD